MSVPAFSPTVEKAEAAREILAKLLNRARVVVDAGERVTEVAHPVDRAAALDALLRAATVLGHDLEELGRDVKRLGILFVSREGIASAEFEADPEDA